MSDYKNYQLRQLGLTKESFQAKKRCVKEMVSPTAKGVAIIGMGVRGSSTGGFPSGIDQTGIPSNTPTGRLGGYEPIPTAKDNSEVIDRTPTNPQINSANPITDNPETNQTPHAHQIQQATDQAPQTVTGASTDSDATLTLKSVLPKDQQTVDIDVAEGDKKPDAMNGEESMESEDKAKAGLQEGKHKTGCKCGFCANKSSFGKKDKEPKSAADNVKKSFEKEDKDEKEEGNPFAKKDKVDETFKRHIAMMKEYLGVNESKDPQKVEANEEEISKWKMDKQKGGMVKLSEAFEKIQEVNYTKDKNGKDVIAVGAPGSQARWEVENPDECYKCKDKKSCECNKKVNETKYSVPFEKMRGLANLGGRRLGSDGLWENTVTSHVLKSTPNKEVIKIDESKLNSITEILSRKKTLTIKEAKLMELANRLSKKRG